MQEYWINAERYHSKLEESKKIVDQLARNKLKSIVATVFLVSYDKEVIQQVIVKTPKQEKVGASGEI